MIASWIIFWHSSPLMCGQSAQSSGCPDPPRRSSYITWQHPWQWWPPAQPQKQPCCQAFQCWWCPWTAPPPLHCCTLDIDLFFTWTLTWKYMSASWITKYYCNIPDSAVATIQFELHYLSVGQDISCNLIILKQARLRSDNISSGRVNSRHIYL